LAYDCPAVTGNPGRFNPIENLAPLADAGVKLYHIHGDADTVVPIQPNTQALQGRYQALGGAITVELVPGGTHGAPAAAFFESQGALQFLLGD
jgi:predicted esterase